MSSEALLPHANLLPARCQHAAKSLPKQMLISSTSHHRLFEEFKESSAQAPKNSPPFDRRPPMFLQRSALSVARRAAVVPGLRRTLATTAMRRNAAHLPATKSAQPVQKLSDIKTADDLLGPGAKPGTVPTDLEQSTGQERLQILGKMEGVDIFHSKPLDASRKGTLQNPIMVRSAGDEQYAGCTGFPSGSHEVVWLTMSRGRPIVRCPECGNVYMIDYVGPQDDHHGQDHHGYVEPKNFSDFVRPEYH